MIEMNKFIFFICVLIIGYSLISFLNTTNIFNTELFENQQYKYKYGILICCYNRPEFLKQTFNSLKQSNLDNSIIYIIDDKSTDQETINLINNFEINNIEIIKHTNDTNQGIQNNIKNGYDFLNRKRCEYITNIDSDVIMKKNWLPKLEETYKSIDTSNDITTHKFILTGFNTTQHSHKIYKTYDNFYEKKNIGGINHFFHNSLFGEIDSKLNKQKYDHWDNRLCEYCLQNNIGLFCTKPSVIQHIGKTGLNSGAIYDYAEDF